MLRMLGPADEPRWPRASRVFTNTHPVAPPQVRAERLARRAAPRRAAAPALARRRHAVYAVNNYVSILLELR